MISSYCLEVHIVRQMKPFAWTKLIPVRFKVGHNQQVATILIYASDALAAR